MRFFPVLTPAMGIALVLFGCQSPEPGKPSAEQPITVEKGAPPPTAKSPFAPDPQMEARIAQLLAQMTLEQKVGQMIQADIGNVTEADIKEFRIGSVLNGGGQTPNNKADSTPLEWVQFAEKLYQASMTPEPGKVPIPLMWGVDAVHGHGNVVGATLYPHNIALGATRNPALVKKIANATALEVAATGIDWNFAPTVAVARDDRWGRTYESFSENPAVVAEMGAAAVAGLQGDVNSANFLDHNHVLACAKHFIGDGGTLFGDDQGNTQGDDAELIRLHLPGYITAIEAGVQTVMASYSWWDGVHAHANKRLLTGLLKEQLGFDGLVVSDWQGIGHIHGCSIDNCATAINAGVDLFMIPNAPDWKNFYRNTLGQVWNGTISHARIDDAVRRILRVKMRAGLWKKPSPMYRTATAQANLVGNAMHRKLARQAVRESMVLLKNNGVLPLSPALNLLVAGPGANSVSMQAGGWSVTWQGKDNPNSMYPGATTIYAGIAKAVEAAGGKAILRENGEMTEPVDAAIVVFGETPYAEMHGDLENLDTLELERGNNQALRLMKQLKSQQIPVVAVFLSGRPRWVNKELNVADAFVAAWQPGSEGAGVADVLLRAPNGSIAHDFSGRLSFSWPKGVCDATVNLGDPDYDPLFPFGYGLSYEETALSGQSTALSGPKTALSGPKKAQSWQALPEDTSEWPYGCRLGKALAEESTTLEFGPQDGWQFYLEKPTLEGRLVKVTGTSGFGSMSARPELSRGFGVEARWDGSGTTRLLMRDDFAQHNLLPLFASDAALTFDIKITRAPKEKVEALLFSGRLTGSVLDISDTLSTLSRDQWHTVSIDLQCFESDRADFSKVDVPFGLQTVGTFAAVITKVRYVPHKAQEAQMRCTR